MLLRYARVLASLSLLIACSQPKPTPTPESKDVMPSSSPAPAAPEDVEENGLTWSIRETESTVPAPEAGVHAPTKPLDAKDAEKVLARLPKLEAEPGAAQAFALRGPSLKPPTSGSTTTLPFPQPEKAPTAKPKAPVVPLKVSRYAPTGEVPIAAQVGVTFSQPMIEVSTVDQANAKVPVKLSPVVEGNWRWMGTQTLVFAPAVRLPMATAFTAEIPKGTKSVNGGVLAEAVKWTFATAPLTLQSSAPRDDSGVQLQPLVFLGFDQKIDPKRVFDFVDMKAGRSSVAIRRASDEEIAADNMMPSYVRSSEPGRYLVIKSEQQLPKATKITVTLQKGAPSAEGPLTTKAPQSFGFTTYGSFKFQEGTCWSDQCRPDSPLVMRFSNSIDSASYKDSMVSVEPAIADQQLVLSGNQIQVNGKKKSRTKYTVTLQGALRDIYGQELEGKAKHTFDIGDAWPRLQLARDGFVTMTPESPRIDVISAGQPTVHVALYKVQPSDWAAYTEFSGQLYHNSGPKAPGKLISEGDVKVAGSPDDLVATPIDLTPGLDKGRGTVVVVVSGKRQYRSDLSRVAAWVQVTPMGLDAFSDATDLVAWVTDLKTGTPISGAAVELVPTKVTAKTDSDGVAKLTMTPSNNDYRQRMLVARHGDDSVMLPNGNWYSQPRGTGYLTWVTDDRGMYKPGETASFKGFVRRLSAAKNASIEAASVKELKYEVNDPRGSKIAEGTFKLSALGGFDFSVKLPDNANLGQAMVYFKDGTDHVGYHHFDIQEFRRPEFEVSASVNDGVHVIGQAQSATVKAAYYAGGALTGAPVNWMVTSSRASFTPPGRDSFIFGTWKPWWYFHHYEERDQLVSTQISGTTDTAGKHSIAIEPKSIKPASAVSIEAQASVTDVNRQTWSARATMLVHPATTYVGVKPERMFVEPGKPASFDIIAVDLDGKAEKDRKVRIEIERNATRVENGQWHEEVVREADETVSTKDTPFNWTFKPKEGGRHRLQFTVTDAQGRANRTELTLWVSGEKRPPVNEVKHDEVTLIPSKKTYEPGDTAEVLVQSPFAEASGIVLVERNGVLSTERIHIKDSSAIVKLPIKEAHAPNVHLAVELTGSVDAPNGKGKRPAYASGALDLAVSTKHLALTVDVVPASRGLEPGSTTEVSAIIKDGRGKPVDGAEVTIIVVDEAVLALSGFTLKDPLALMTPHRERDVSNTYIRDSVVLARVEAEEDMEEKSKEAMADGMEMPAPAMMMAQAPAKRMRAKAEAPGEPEQQIAVRKDFSALAAFVPKLTSNGAGKVTTTVKLPDNLTRYRVMAVAAGSVSQFGKGESTITARLPLMVRPSAPRFLNFGDSFELPAVVHNQTEQAMDVDVVARAVNLELAQAGFRVRVEPGQRVEVRFPAKTVSAG
ncbi:MAG TPA: Ig-like domain-containing protein, partial [Myxococcota bacterium]|nr:Ig-like domain-containing protein [Myxococcota bacterium]